jgi:hypothetical protein
MKVKVRNNTSTLINVMSTMAILLLSIGTTIDSTDLCKAGFAWTLFSGGLSIFTNISPKSGMVCVLFGVSGLWGEFYNH